MSQPQQSFSELPFFQGNFSHTWELFHENSKINLFSIGPSEKAVWERMRETHESLEFAGYPIIKLPTEGVKLASSLQEAILTRVSVRDFVSVHMSLKNITTLLHCAYGVTRDNRGTKFPRAFRVTPSGGALYPLEIFFFSSKVKNLIPGLYHYNPSKHHLRFLRKGNFASVIAQRTPFPNLVKKASLLIFITALFERSIFKYGDRGYRFVFLEAGHVAQNLNLVSNAMGLNSVNIGGFYDREMDDFLGLDGITHSTIYLTAIGKNAKEAARALPLRNKIRKDLLPLGVHERRRNEKKPKYK